MPNYAAEMEAQAGVGYSEAKAADRPAAPVDDCLRWLEKDVVLLTHLVDQLDTRLATVLGEGTPRAGADPEPPAPGSSQLVTALAVLHARLAGELGRLERVMLRVEVG